MYPADLEVSPPASVTMQNYLCSVRTHTKSLSPRSLSTKGKGDANWNTEKQRISNTCSLWVSKSFKNNICVSIIFVFSIGTKHIKYCMFSIFIFLIEKSYKRLCALSVVYLFGSKHIKRLCAFNVFGVSTQSARNP